MALAFAKPAATFLFENTDKNTGLTVNFGIPTTWYKTAEDAPPETITPVNTIGLDTLCAYVHLKCAGPGIGIYTTHCSGDPFGRTYSYPPLMALVTAWLAWLPVEKAVATGSFLAILSVFASAYFWLRFSKNVSAAVTAFFFTLSYPSLFAFERGNNDFLILALVSFCGCLLVRKRWFFLGSLLSAAALLKIYPVTLWASFFILAAFLIIAGPKTKFKKAGFSILVGQVLSAAAITIPMFGSYRYYFEKHMPWYVEHFSHVDPARVINHSLPLAFGKPGLLFGIFLWLLGTASLLLSCRRWLSEKAPAKKTVLSFVYLSAVMTYLIPSESVDYNLILVIPFLAVAGEIFFKKYHWVALSGIFLWTLGYALPRGSSEILPLSLTTHFSFFLLLECAGMLLMAFMLFMPFKSDDQKNP